MIHTAFGDMSETEYQDTLRIISHTIQNMNSGVYNHCVDGECIGCGECCSNLLPMSDSEIKQIKKIVRKNGLKPIKHEMPGSAVFAQQPIDMVCPFCDINRGDKKCVIYADRPLVCRDFKCDKCGKGYNVNPAFLKEEFRAVVLTETFWDEKGNIK